MFERKEDAAESSASNYSVLAAPEDGRTPPRLCPAVTNPLRHPLLACFKSSARNWATSLNLAAFAGLMSISVWWASRQARVTSALVGLAGGGGRCSACSGKGMGP